MNRFWVYLLISIVFGCLYAGLASIWFPGIWIYVLLVSTVIIFLMLCIVCMGNYSVEFKDKDDDIQTK